MTERENNRREIEIIAEIWENRETERWTGSQKDGQAHRETKGHPDRKTERWEDI
jgi:hypothetical protein